MSEGIVTYVRTNRFNNPLCMVRYASDYLMLVWFVTRGRGHVEQYVEKLYFDRYPELRDVRQNGDWDREALIWLANDYELVMEMESPGADSNQGEQQEALDN